MNNKKAKAIRKQATQFAIANDIPLESSYTQSHVKNVTTKGLMGEDLNLSSSTFTLHNCVRVLYKTLKKEYKGEFVC